MTLLEAVNAVLVKFRDPKFVDADLTDDPYGELLVSMVNDAKREIEDAYDWNSMRSTTTVTCVPGTPTYKLTGTNDRVRVRYAWNDTFNCEVKAKNARWITERMLTTPENGTPQHYGFNGIDTATREVYVDLYPVPNGTDVIRFNLTDKQTDLTAGSDEIRVPAHLVILGAYAAAQEERGQGGPLDARGRTKARLVFEDALATAITGETNAFPGEQDWTVR